MPTEPEQDVARVAQRIVQARPGGAAYGATPDASIEADDDHRPLVAIDEPPRDDADDARVPARAPDDDGGLSLEALALDLGIRRTVPAVDPMKLDRLTVILTADHA